MKSVGPFERVRWWCEDNLRRILMTLAGQRARWQEPTLFNAARGRPAFQSSTPRNAKLLGAHRGTDGRTGGRGCFRTESGDPRPWWMVQLKADWPIHSIRIHACRQLPALEPARLQVSLSADGERWEVVHAGPYPFGDQAPAGPLTISLLDTRGGRFVKLELPDGGQLSFNQIEVMVERRHLAMRRVAKRYKFSFERVTSLRMRPHVKPYSLRNLPADFNGKIEALHLNAAQGRFGNNVRQIGTAVCLARRLGIRRLYLCKLPLLEIAQAVTFDGVTVLPDVELERDNPQSVLCGTFYYKEVFGRMDRMEYRRIAEAARGVVRPIFDRLAVQPGLVPDATDLVIHLRAGDIFAKKTPHLFYVQPPLAFYQMCVEFARTELGIKRVVLVYEDEGNPCIGALKAWFGEIGLPHVVQSHTLPEDLAVLVAAQHCVFGRGSFGLAVAILSRNMRTVFHSWLEPNIAVLPEVCGIQAIGVEDSAKGYIPLGSWARTPEQLQMMLDYPRENLRLTPGLLPDRRGAAEEPLVVAPQPQIQ